LLLCFHGNGELAEEYDDLGAVYVERGLHFLVVDDCGYGRSTGQPTVTAMRADSLVILDFVTGWRRQQGQTGPLIVLGRSLGSAPALELAYRRPEALRRPDSGQRLRPHRTPAAAARGSGKRLR
jgi:alpha-beta hydrolase superfamily lysophospholipase